MHFWNYELILRNLTFANLFVMVLAMFIVEAFRVTGRRPVKKRRRKVTLQYYLGVPLNVWSLALSFACAVFLQIIREGVVQSAAISVLDPETFGLWYSAIVGSGSQGLLKPILKAGRNQLAGPEGTGTDA